MKLSGDERMRDTGEARHGRLKIFLGAAPGVGKTYEMLKAAQSRRHDGVTAHWAFNSTGAPAPAAVEGSCDDVAERDLAAEPKAAEASRALAPASGS